MSLTRSPVLGSWPKKQQLLGSGTSVTVAIVTGVLQVLPPSVDLESKNVAWVPPQSPVGPVALQRIQETKTVPSLPIARSLNWSTCGETWTLSTAVVFHVSPP